MTINPLVFHRFPELNHYVELSSLMRAWINEGSLAEQPHREILCRLVGQSLRSQTISIEIEGLNHSSFPEFLAHPMIASKIHQLKIVGTRIRELPESISQFSNLQKLILEDNPNLESLPDIFQNLAQLRHLDISCYKERVDDPDIDLKFPESFQCLRLESLMLSAIKSERIQPWLGSQRSLRCLLLKACNYNAIPDEIFSFTHLKTLDLQENFIVQIDERIQNLRNLERLSLVDNRITAVNPAVFLLPRSCEVDLEGNSLDYDEFQRIQTIISDAAFMGPQLLLDAESESYETSDDEQENFQELLDNFFSQLGQARPRCLDSLEQDQHTASLVCALIKRLQRNIPTTHRIAKKAFTSLADSLSLAALNPEFKSAFCDLVEGATTTCGDGIIAIILRLSLLRKEIALDLDKPKIILDFILRGKLAMSILESSASLLIQNKTYAIESSIKQAYPLMTQEGVNRLVQARVNQEIDPVEVYLIYPIALSDRLQLPLEVDDMFFRSLSGVEKKDLELAAKNVETTLANRASIVDFLLEDALWLKLLQRNYYTVLNELNEKQKELNDLSQEESAPDSYVAFYQEKKRILQELTEKLLEQLITFNEPESKRFKTD